jgi:hypothetical protein
MMKPNFSSKMIVQLKYVQLSHPSDLFSERVITNFLRINILKRKGPISMVDWQHRRPNCARLGKKGISRVISMARGLRVRRKVKVDQITRRLIIFIRWKSTGLSGRES